MKRCYEFLNQTSRSFAAVIQALDDDLRCVVVIRKVVKGSCIKGELSVFCTVSLAGFEELFGTVRSRDMAS